MSSHKVRWGILGTSKISKVMANAIHESTVSELLGIASRSHTSAKAFADECNVAKCYDQYDALLSDPEIDAVYIGLPNHLHKEWIIRAALAGKHILCEKPFVTNLQDAQDVLAMVRKANVFCMEALMYRCHPFITKLRELMQEKVIGEVRLFNAVYMADIASVANKTEGGSILNLGCYPISLVRLLAGCAHGKQTAEPSDVISIGEMDGKRNNDSRASVVMHFPNQMMAMVSVADDMGMYSQFDIYGTEGHLKAITNPWMPAHKNKIVIHRKGESDIEIEVSADQSLYSYQIDTVSRSIMDGKFVDDHEGISWLDTLGNTIVLEAWLKQVKAKAVVV